MEPQIKNKRQQYPGGNYVETTDLSQWNEDNASDNIFEPMDDFNDIDDMENYNDSEYAFESADVNPDMTGDDEKRRIEALKRAIEIAKLMSNVTIEGIIAIAEQVDKYLTENA